MIQVEIDPNSNLPIDDERTRERYFQQIKTLVPEIKYTQEGLVVLDGNNDQYVDKIVSDYNILRLRIQNAIDQGKHVLILPGTYDLLHAGHVAWFAQALDFYIKSLGQRGVGLHRNDLFVVAPFDSDTLVKIVKARKHVSKGGTECFMRPIIESDLRALALANLPFVDAVAAIPSPLEIDRILMQPQDFSVDKAQNLLDLNYNSGLITEDDYRQLKNGFRVYRLLQNDSTFGSVKKAFSLMGLSKQEAELFMDTNKVSPDDFAIQAWQLMTHLHKINNGKVMNPKALGYATRVVSNWDSAYNQQVAFLMSLAGIEIQNIWDAVVVSTTSILKQYGQTPEGIEYLVNSIKGAA